MKLAHYFIEPIEFTEGTINTLVIENENLFFELTKELFSQVAGEDGRFVLSTEKKQLNISKELDVEIDFFNIDASERKIVTKLYNKLKSIAMEDYYTETSELYTALTNYMQKIVHAVDAPLTYNDEYDLNSLLKLAGISIELDNTSLISKLQDYCKIMSEYLGTKAFVFINLRSFLSESDFNELIKVVTYEKISILLMEGYIRNHSYENEKVRIIDKDLCQI